MHAQLNKLQIMLHSSCTSTKKCDEFEIDLARI